MVLRVDRQYLHFLDSYGGFTEDISGNGARVADVFDWVYRGRDKPKGSYRGTVLKRIKQRCKKTQFRFFLELMLFFEVDD